MPFQREHIGNNFFVMPFVNFKKYLFPGWSHSLFEVFALSGIFCNLKDIPYFVWFLITLRFSRPLLDDKQQVV